VRGTLSRRYAAIIVRCPGLLAAGCNPVAPHSARPTSSSVIRAVGVEPMTSVAGATGHGYSSDPYPIRGTDSEAGSIPQSFSDGADAQSRRQSRTGLFSFGPARFTDQMVRLARWSFSRSADSRMITGRSLPEVSGRGRLVRFLPPVRADSPRGFAPARHRPRTRLNRGVRYTAPKPECLSRLPNYRAGVSATSCAGEAISRTTPLSPYSGEFAGTPVLYQVRTTSPEP